MLVSGGSGGSGTHSRGGAGGGLIGANGQTPNDNFTIPADRSLIPGAGDSQTLGGRGGARACS